MSEVAASERRRPPEAFTAEDLENAIKSAIARPSRAWGTSCRMIAPSSPAGARLWQSPDAEVRQIIRQAARADVTVLICGRPEPARISWHGPFMSLACAGPVLRQVNCAAVPRELLESELFGHERGAFTGAHQLRLASSNRRPRTIFLDEIGDLHPALQASSFTCCRTGSSPASGQSTIKVDVRVLAATNQNLEQAVAAGRFRDDLYYA